MALHGRFHRRMSRDDDWYDVQLPFIDFPQNLQAVGARQTQVANEHVVA